MAKATKDKSKCVTCPYGQPGVNNAGACQACYRQAATERDTLARRVAKLERLILSADLGSREALACPQIPAEARRIAKRGGSNG